MQAAETMTPPAASLPPPSMFTRALRRERLDRSILRSLGERRTYRALRQSGRGSAWDGLESLVVGASTSLWEHGTAPTKTNEDLAAYCAFLARELELAEQMDLPADRDASRLRLLAPRAIAALDAIDVEQTGPVGAAFAAIRAELLDHLVGSATWRLAA